MQKFNSVRSWLANVAFKHSKSKSTMGMYRYWINLFFEFIGKNAEEVLDEYEGSTDREFRRKYARYIKALIADKMNEGYAPNSINGLVTAIKSYFKYNDLPLGFVPIGRQRIVFHNRDITKEEVIKIINASRPRDRAFFIMMLQTGLRPATLCRLRLRHISPDFELEKIPCKVEVPEELAKGKYRSYFTFMGLESVKALKAYFSMRKNMNKESLLFVSRGSRAHEISPKTFSAIFNRTIRRFRETNEIDFEVIHDKPAELRLYNLRKYFRKYANQAGFEFVQFWMGHVVKAGVDEHYRPKDVEFHRQLYAEKAMPFLRIEEATPSETERTIEELREQLKQRDKRLEVLEEFQKKTLEKLEEYATFARELKELLPKDKRKKIIEELRKRRKQENNV